MVRSHFPNTPWECAELPLLRAPQQPSLALPGFGGSAQQMGPDCSQGRVSHTTHVSHSGAFALDSVAGKQPRARHLCISTDDECSRVCCEIEIYKLLCSTVDSLLPTLDVQQPLGPLSPLVERELVWLKHNQVSFPDWGLYYWLSQFILRTIRDIAPGDPAFTEISTEDKEVGKDWQNSSVRKCGAKIQTQNCIFQRLVPYYTVFNPRKDDLLIYYFSFGPLWFLF